MFIFGLNVDYLRFPCRLLPRIIGRLLYITRNEDCEMNNETEIVFWTLALLGESGHLMASPWTFVAPSVWSTCMNEWINWKPTHYYLVHIEFSLQFSRCLYFFSLSVWPSDSGLARNKRKPQEIQNPRYQLHRYEMCLMQAWLTCKHANYSQFSSCFLLSHFI